MNNLGDNPGLKVPAIGKGVALLEAVARVLFGPAGVAETVRPGSIVIDMSSISPLAGKEFAARLAERGIGCLDAPVSGGEVGAKAATLTIMVGGPADLFERVRPVLELMGRNINQVGEHGAGQTTKVANQIIVALTIEAVSEAPVFASRAGADPARVREALLGGFASSRVLEVRGERMIKRNFAPGFRVELHQKDLNLALENARADVDRRVLGIAGAGRIGRNVARKARAFDMEILYSDVAANEAIEAESGAELARMKPSAILVNASRGAVVDEKALVEALRERRIAGAALDVFEYEPALAPGLVELTNVVLVPHIASATEQTRLAMGEIVSRNVLAVLAGEAPDCCINPEALSRGAAGATAARARP